jgi:hypothetical protein
VLTPAGGTAFNFLDMTSLPTGATHANNDGEIHVVVSGTYRLRTSGGEERRLIVIEVPIADARTTRQEHGRS